MGLFLSEMGAESILSLFGKVNLQFPNACRGESKAMRSAVHCSTLMP